MQNARENKQEREDGSPEIVTRELVERYLSIAESDPELSSKEKERFVAIAVTYQLNPFKRELHAKVSFEGGKRQMHLIVGYEVYIKKAERTDLLDGWKAWIEGSGETLKAVVEIQRKDWKNPFIHEVYWSEAVQRRSDGAVYDFWERMPKFQLKKVAISQGFRMCFSNEIGGIPYDGAELPIQEMPTAQDTESAVPGQQTTPAAKKTSTNVHSEKSVVGLPEVIHQLVMQNSALFSDQHLAWIENQLRSEKTEAQLRGLQKHVEETIASGGDERSGQGNPRHSTGIKQPSVKRRIPVTRPNQTVPREIPIF